MPDRDNRPDSPLEDTLAGWRLKKLEDDSIKHGKDIEKTKDRVTKVEGKAVELGIYIEQILHTVEDISTDFKKLDDVSSQRHETQQEKWIGFFQKITYLVIGALITYLFSQLR